MTSNLLHVAAVYNLFMNSSNMPSSQYNYTEYSCIIKRTTCTRLWGIYNPGIIIT